MIQTCPVHQLRWNDQTVRACPLCNERTLMDVRRDSKGEMRNGCGVCSNPFVNSPKWWTQHGNICPRCTHAKLSPKIAKAKAPQRAVIKGKLAEAFVEAYDKLPTALDLEQFKPWYRARKKVEVFADENEE